MNIHTSQEQENDSLKEYQNNDMEILSIKGRLLTNNTTKKDKHYVIKKGVLFYKRPDMRVPIPYLPKKLRRVILEEAHDNKVYCHPGINKTYRFLAERYYWRNMKSHIASYVKSCDTCQKIKASRMKPSGLYQFKDIQELPCQKWEMDLCGPFPRSIRGNKYIISITCMFSKYIILHPVPNGTSEDVAKVLIDRVILKFGNPVEIRSDNGTHFNAGIIRELTKMLGISHVFGTVYHFKSIGSNERVHDVLNTKLRALVSEKCTDWDKFLPFIEHSMNSMHSTSTGISAFKALYGFEPLVPSQLVYGGHKYGFIGDVSNRWTLARSLAQDALVNSQVTYEKHNNKTRRHEEFSINQKVLTLRFTRKKKIPNKLCPIYHGPF